MSPSILDGDAGGCGSALRPAPCARCPAPGLLCRSLPGQGSVSWNFELQASVRVALKRVRLEVPEPNLGFLPIGAISNLHACSFLYRLILVWQEKIAVISRAHSCGRLKFIAGAAAR